MHVRITKGRRIPHRPEVIAGETVDLSDDLARALIDQGCAEAEVAVAASPDITGGSVLEATPIMAGLQEEETDASDTEVAEPVDDSPTVEEEE